jgi:RNA polymerase sigma-70 factor, ECF subfamily
VDSLLERAKAGQPEAMHELLTSIAPSIQRFGLRMCRNEQDAQDVLQDALLTIANHLGEFEGRSSFSSWAFALARSACSRKRRGLKNQPHLPLEEPPDVDEPPPSPEQQVANRELAEALNSALDALPEIYREVILLRDVEAMTAPETAEALGISIEAVKSRLHRARSALRDRLTPVLEPQPAVPQGGCPDVLALWSNKLEGDLSPTDCAAMEAHIQGCAACASACNALKAALLACKRAGKNEVRPEIQTQVKAALQEWVLGEAKPGIKS